MDTSFDPGRLDSNPETSSSSRLCIGLRRRSRWRNKTLIQQVHCRLVHFRVQLVAFIRAGDVSHRNFDAAHDRLYIDCWRRGESMR
jgi:hypothetical protein